MNERKIEIKVGAFILIGLIAIGVLIVCFGRFGDMFSRSYEITVKFSNASGIIKDSQILYRGAKIGSVAAPPKIIDQGKAVELTLKIRTDILIPRNSTFQIGSYGLLGDRFVDINTPDQADASYFASGEHVEGLQQNSKGLGDLAQQAQPIIRRLDEISAKIDQQVLNDTTVQDLQATLANAKSLSGRIDSFMAQAEKGQGTIYLLMNDKQMAADLKQSIKQFKDLSYNLRENGILFYENSAAEKEAEKKNGNR